MEITDQRTLARWMLAAEMRDHQGPEAPAEGAESACSKLCRRLALLVTVSGGQRLLARALHLARSQFPFLGEIRVGTTPDTCLSGLKDSLCGVDPEEAREGLVVMLGILIGLLDTFIGEELTLRLVYDVWPDARWGGEERDSQEA